MSTEELAAFTLDFVRSEFVPTLWALVVAALRDFIAEDFAWQTATITVNAQQSS